MLNISEINSHVIHLNNPLEVLERSVFIKQLSHELVLGSTLPTKYKVYWDAITSRTKTDDIPYNQ